TLDEIGVLGQARGENFHGDNAVERYLAGFVNNAHAALSNDLQNFASTHGGANQWIRRRHYIALLHAPRISKNRPDIILLRTPERRRKKGGELAFCTVNWQISSAHVIAIYARFSALVL